MKLQLISDLHTEFYDRPLEMLEGLKFIPDIDVLLLPGDIVVPTVTKEACLKRSREALDFLAKKAPCILFLAGNHEYYHSDKPSVELILEAMMPSNFHWLRDESVTVAGHHFFGGTMWFPYSSRNLMYQNQLNDFLLIKDFKRWVYEENTKFVEAARKQIRGDTVVLTHHIPSYQAVHPKFQGDPFNRFFACNMDALIESAQPKLWVYGHTHLPGDMTIGKTRVVCNPHGYPSERQQLGPYEPVVFNL